MASIDLDEAAEQRTDLPDVEEVYDFGGEIPLTDLFDDGFVRDHTEFESFDELVAASPSNADSASELETVPQGVWDEFVAETTTFEDEKALVLAARDRWVAKKLNLI